MEEENRTCKKHGITLYKNYTEGNGNQSFRCLKCRAESIKSIYKKKKLKAVEYLGGKCSKCGYNKSMAALDFHHINPEEKEGTPSRILNRSWKNIIKELNKCIILCANCHREEHEN